MKAFIAAAAAVAAVSASAAEISSGYPVTPVNFTAVSVDDPFWTPRLKASREVTVPLAFRKCEESGRYLNFVRAAAPCDTFTIAGFPFDDTDVYKTIEGASYLLHTYPDSRLEAYMDSVIAIVAAAQEPDGYLNTSYTANPLHPHPWMSSQKWEKVEHLSHEFYNLGHLIEGAVAHYNATGRRNFLDIAIRYADCVCRNIGPSPGQLDRVPGHQIAEMALTKLYLTTADEKYLRQARYFLDRRGHTSRTDAYSQAHLPVTEQSEAVGHAVRAAYMYSGMADVAALTADSAYIRAIDRIWDNIVSRKLYITGGIGATHAGEAFGADYQLPNHEAYCETCAAIGNVYLNHRLFLLHGDAKYYDVLERTLYNGVIAGVSMQGDKFFYPNPLASEGGYERKEWFGCACCPSNVCRFIPSLPGYVYAVRDSSLYVNLFIGNSSSVSLGGKPVEISLTGDYVRQGNATVRIDSSSAGEFSLRIRIPGWARNAPVPSRLYSYADTLMPGYALKLNGEDMHSVSLESGYAVIKRHWKAGDRVDISFDMTPRMVVAHEAVEADRGRVAIERGPVVYCAEWADNPVDLRDVTLPADAQFSTSDSSSLGGVTVIDAQASGFNIRLIPYYAWAHRGPGQMTVWLPSHPNTPVLPIAN